MHTVVPSSDSCSVRIPELRHARERGVRAVVALTTAMMVLEIAVGYATGSMALLADGWHMATHVGALGMASAAYALARRFAGHRAFAFGTGKVHALAGYTSAVALGMVALAMLVESVERLFRPGVIDFARSLPVAVVGLVVNLVSVKLLHGGDDAHHHHDDEHGRDHHDHHHDHDHHHHGHDHNHRAAVMHVMADTLTSALAIVALVLGQQLGFGWLDPVSGIVGGLVIARWGVSLCRSAAFELLDVDPSSELERRIRSALEALHDVRVRDLHVWSLGRGRRSCVVTLVASVPREPDDYRARILEAGELAHLTVEVHRCPDHA